MKQAKILKEKSREYKGTSYYKYKVNIPETILSFSDLKAGDFVELSASKGIIQLKRVEKEEKRV